MTTEKENKMHSRLELWPNLEEARSVGLFIKLLLRKILARTRHVNLFTGTKARNRGVLYLENLYKEVNCIIWLPLSRS